MLLFRGVFRSAQARLAITHVTVIDATGAPPQPDMTVLIVDQRIAALGPSGSTPVPRGAQILDATGKFLIPGLADMHVHLTGAGEPAGRREFILPLLMANGITTVRDMGGNVEDLLRLRYEITSGVRPGPQIFFTGPYLDGDPPAYQPSIVVKSAPEARAAVDRLALAGVDFIKTQSRLERDAYFAIAEEAGSCTFVLSATFPIASPQSKHRKLARPASSISPASCSPVPQRKMNFAAPVLYPIRPTKHPPGRTLSTAPGVANFWTLTHRKKRKPC